MEMWGEEEFRYREDSKTNRTPFFIGRNSEVQEKPFDCTGRYLAGRDFLYRRTTQQWNQHSLASNRQRWMLCFKGQSNVRW